MKFQTTIKVLLIDDKSPLRRIIELYLQMQEGIELIAASRSVDTVIPLLDNDRPSVILLGLRTSTIDDVQRLRRMVPETPMILMGLFQDIDVESLTLHFDAYIDKSTLIDTLVPQIKKLANGKKLIRQA